MADQWYYRMFGEEFGPVSVEKLKELADSGTIQALDHIRRDGTGEWVVAATIDELGLSTSERRTATLVEPTIDDFDFSASGASSQDAISMASIDDFDLSSPQEMASIDDFDLSSSQESAGEQWFCQLGENELGPLTFEELLKFAEHEQLCADDQVKLGSTGKWRRAGSIGRLMAALPYKGEAKTIVPGARPKGPAESLSLDDFEIAPSSAPVPDRGPVAARAAAPQPVAAAAPAVDSEATFRVAYEQARARLTESMLAQADAVFKTAEDQAKSQIAWATAPNVDKFWWGWANGVEFGPVEFAQVFGLAKSGQLKPSDFVRNGSHGQFVPSSGVPGLFKAVELIARATEARDLARSQAQAAAALAVPPPAAPTALIKAAEKAVAAEQAAAQQVVAQHAVAQVKSNPAISIPAPTPRSNPTMDTVRRPSSDPQVATRDIDYESESQPQRSDSGRPSYNSSTPIGGGYSSGMSGGGMGGGGFGSSSSSSMSTYGMNRPAPIPSKPIPRKSSASSSTWMSDMLENLKEPKAIGSICAIAFVMLIFGWNFLPKSRSDDIKKYNALKGLMDEVKTKRNSSPTELAALQQKLGAVGKQIALELKNKASREEPAKQCLLWVARDELPQLVTIGIAKESAAEIRVLSRLKEAAYELGLEKRPPIDPTQLAARNND